MNTKQRQREIDKAAWRIHREVCHSQQERPRSGLLLFLILWAVGYWLAHCV